MIEDYFSKVKSKLNEIKFLIKSEITNFERISEEMGIIKGRLIFIDNSMLDLMELIGTNEHDYRFQWVDSRKRLIVRWDTAPHHRELGNFPFHKHTTNKVESSKEFNFIHILDILKVEIIKRVENMEF